MFKKCRKCGNLVYVIEKNNEIKCCNEIMSEVNANSKDASFEKHIPNITMENNQIKVVVNHVMENNHFIEWIALENNKQIKIKKLKPSEEAVTYFEYEKDATIYSYCNKHGLWKSDIKQ